MDIRLPRWSVRHVRLAPFGILATTYLLTYIDKPLGWRVWELWKVWGDLAALAEMVDLGILVYIVLASIVEWLVRMAYYAIEKIQNERQKLREEGRKAGLEEGQMMGIDLVLTELEQFPDVPIEDVKKAVEASIKESKS